MIMRKEYLTPTLKERDLDLDRAFLASTFPSSQNENIEETDYQW